MASVRDLLGVDFDGHSIEDPEDVIDAGLGDLRHHKRVGPLAAILEDSNAAGGDRLQACIALATWGESSGYLAIVAAAAEPTQTPWHGVSIDRKFSADNTFAPLSTAIWLSNEIAAEKGTGGDRLQALVALIGIADRAYFDEKIGPAIASGPTGRVASAVETTIRRGIQRITFGERCRFDLATQLVDLAVTLAGHNGRTAADLAISVLATEPAERTLLHATSILLEADRSDSEILCEYLRSIGGPAVQKAVTEGLETAGTTKSGRSRK